MANTPNIPTPSPEQVTIYLEKWKNLENYTAQESSLNKLFHKTYPENKCMDEVLIKVCALNALYSTNIRYLFQVAQHIVDLEIDERLKKGNRSLVQDITKITITKKIKNDEGRNIDETEIKPINYYSFATKYCSHHVPEKYSIYDSYVDKMLWHFQKQFSDFKRKELKTYERFAEVIEVFRKKYELDKFSLKQIDQYLWMAGKEAFTYSKKKTKTP